MMETSCAEVMDRVSALIDRELDDSATTAVWRHFEACADCCRECAQLLCLDALARSVPEAESPHQLWERIERLLPPGASSFPEILTPEEAAAVLRISAEQLEAAVDTIPHIRIGDAVRFRWAALQSWITAQEQETSLSSSPHFQAHGRVVDLGQVRRSRIGVK